MIPQLHEEDSNPTSTIAVPASKTKLAQPDSGHTLDNKWCSHMNAVSGQQAVALLPRTSLRGVQLTDKCWFASSCLHRPSLLRSDPRSEHVPPYQLDSTGWLPAGTQDSAAQQD